MNYCERRNTLTGDHNDTVFVFTAHHAGARRRRWNSDRFYLSGCDDLGALVCWSRGAVLFVEDRSDRELRFDGAALDLEVVRERARIDDIRALSELPAALPNLLREGQIVAYELGGADDVVIRALKQSGVTRGAQTRRAVVDPRSMTASLRVRKSPDELEIMRTAGAASARAHDAVRAALAVGTTGHELCAVAQLEAARNGAPASAYDTIVAIDDEALTLHAKPTARRASPASSVLVDAGFEVEHYASDITRTWGVHSLHGPRAEALHAVREAHAAALDVARPGARLRDVHAAARRALQDALRDLAPKLAIDQVFVHRTSHWIGLDVHDPGPADAELEPGMTFTVEPGLYFGDDAPRELRGFGARWEDVLAVTSGDPELLTHAAAKNSK